METFVNEKRGDVNAFAHAAVDAGADLVFGNGPHVAGPWSFTTTG